MKIKAIALMAALPLLAQAKVTLPQFFTDSMVVQHSRTLTIPGTAKPGSTVRVQPGWGGSAIKAKAGSDGRFSLQVPTPAPGGPYTLTITDGHGPAVTLSEVWAGEVWLCSGQSNMEMPVQGWGKVMDYHREVEQAGDPLLRLLQVRKQTAYAPQPDTQVSFGGWRSANPEVVADFSAIGYFFGRQMRHELDVPIGIIDCTWGGTPIEAWTAYSTLAGLGEFSEQLQAMADCGFDDSDLTRQYQQQLSEWTERNFPATPPFDLGKTQDSLPTMAVPGRWETSVLPGFDGVVWMQRTFDVADADAGKAAELRLAMIDDEDITYVNGTVVGQTHGYNTDRLYSIPAGLLRSGENTISVRVTDANGEGGIWGRADDLWVQPRAGAKIPLNGRWRYLATADFSIDPKPVSPKYSHYPTVLYNAMLSPLTCMPVKGVLWYQGCSNVGRAEQYSRVFPAMIAQWRQAFADPEMPFLFVQLAGYLEPQRLQPGSQWAALRQAQTSALQLPATAMAVAIDLGDPTDIHPKNKQQVAARLAAHALDMAYQRPTACRSPQPIACDFDGRRALLTFDADVLMPGSGTGFIASDGNGRWAVAYARSIGPRQIEVTCDDIDAMHELRYDWADYPDGTLIGTDLLPVAPFREEKGL